jgi:hypothetical protein
MNRNGCRRIDHGCMRAVAIFTLHGMASHRIARGLYRRVFWLCQQAAPSLGKPEASECFRAPTRRGESYG